MPIVEPAPWRHQYFAHVPCPDDVYIPADDPEAWAWNPPHAWVFDKLRLALSHAGAHAVPDMESVRHFGGILPQQDEIVAKVRSRDEVHA